MFEYMIQGIARAGGVEVPAGRTVFAATHAAPRRVGVVRRSTGRLLQWGARSLQWGATRLLEPRVDCRAAG